MSAHLWRLGGHTEAQPGPLVSIWSYDPGEPPDEHGRRPSDRLVGSLLREDAERAVKAVNALEHHRHALRQLTSAVGVAAEVCPRCNDVMGCET